MTTELTQRIADKINVKHESLDVDFRAAAQSAVERAADIGNLLIEAKSSVNHGEWGEWVAVNLRFGRQQAARYMTVASNVARGRHLDTMRSVRLVNACVEPSPTLPATSKSHDNDTPATESTTPDEPDSCDTTAPVTDTGPLPDCTEFDDLVRDLKRVRNRLANFCEHDDTGVAISANRCDTDFKNILGELRLKRPYKVCPYCQAGEADCKECDNCGWVCSFVFDTAPLEMRAAVEATTDETERESVPAGTGPNQWD